MKTLALALTNPEKFGRVAVLMGGSAAEREVSLRSGTAVYDALKRKGVDALAIDVIGSPIDALAGLKIDRVFNIIHGRRYRYREFPALPEPLAARHLRRRVRG